MGERCLPEYDHCMAFDYESLTDDELIKRIRLRGAVDERPISVLFQRHYTMIWKVCRRFMTTDADAEDMLQEVFLRAYQGLPAFKGQSRFSTWLYRIAVNVSLNEIRKRRRGEVHVIPIDEISPQSDQSHHREEHQREEMSEELSTALASLPDEAREALRLREIENRPYEEIASLLGIKTSAAKMRVQRARLALLAYLSEQQES